MTTESQVLKTACNRDCPDACGLRVTVENGKAVRLQGDPNHPVTQGFICHRTSRFLERQYDPDRITTPLLRSAGGELQPAAWDQVLDFLAERMSAIKKESGPAAILHYRCGGSMGMMKLVTDYFFEKFGPVTIKTGDICTGAGDAAQTADFGEEDSHDLFDLLNSKTIILWGKNPYVSQVHLLPILKRAKQNGARLILIDPVHHRTASLCDQFVQPRPGADIALALAVAQVMIREQWHDAGAKNYCDHFDDFESLAFARPLEAWSELADVATEEVELLARSYSDGPSAILVGWGMQRRAQGAATIRTIDALASISGNLGVVGGGVSFYYQRRSAFDLSFVRGESVAPRTIPEPLLGPGILEANDPPIRMVWVTAANPVAMLPDSRTVADALKSRELTVVVDSFLTDTARCADVVLPTTTMLEEDDLLGAYGHHWLAEMRPVVEPPAGVKSDYEIARQLARRVGMNGEFSRDVKSWKERLLSGVAYEGASLEDLRRQAVKNPRAKPILFEDRKFATPSGRVNLIRNVEARPPATSPERPLLLMALSTENSQGSQWVHGSLDEYATAVVHPSAASEFVDGELAVVRSEIGEMTVRLQFDPQQRPDVLLIPKGGWLRDGHCANALIRAEQSDAGGCAVYYDTAVSLEQPSQSA